MFNTFKGSVSLMRACISIAYESLHSKYALNQKQKALPVFTSHETDSSDAWLQFTRSALQKSLRQHGLSEGMAIHQSSCNAVKS